MLDFLAPIWNLIVYNPMVNAMLLIYSIIPNYGLSIILYAHRRTFDRPIPH